MLPRRTFYIIGSSFVLVSFILLAQSFGGLTGFAIYEANNQTTQFYMVMFWFLLTGLFILLVPKILNQGSNNSKSS
jgi:hypothetical protein